MSNSTLKTSVCTRDGAYGSLCADRMFTRRWLVYSWLIGSSSHRQHTCSSSQVKSVPNPFPAHPDTPLPPDFLHFLFRSRILEIFSQLAAGFKPVLNPIGWFCFSFYFFSKGISFSLMCLKMMIFFSQTHFTQ